MLCCVGCAALCCDGPAAAGMRERPYYARYGSARLLVHGVVTSKYFDLAIAAVIGLNVVTMAMEYYKMPQVSLGCSAALPHLSGLF